LTPLWTPNPTRPACATVRAASCSPLCSKPTPYSTLYDTVGRSESGEDNGSHYHALARFVPIGRSMDSRLRGNDAPLGGRCANKYRGPFRPTTTGYTNTPQYPAPPPWSPPTQAWPSSD
jgi:hypothetical protein